MINTPGASFKTVSGDRAQGVVLMSLDDNGIAGPVAAGAGGPASTVSVANFPAVQTVSGQVAVGSPPVNPPLSVSGVDGSGNRQHLLTDTSGRQIVNINGTVQVSDSQSAAFQGVVAITPGTPTTAQRSLGFVCTTAGNITLTLADTSTITLPIQTGGGAFQTLPFAVTNVALGTGTAGTFWGSNKWSRR